MAYSVVHSLLRRAIRLPLSSALCARYCPALTYTSLVSSSHTSSLVARDSTQGLRHPPSFLSLRFASSKVGAEENLLKVLDSEIDCVQEPKDPSNLDVPENFPFEIVDNPGEQTITLKREYGNEKIQVTVYMNLDGEEDIKEDDEDDHDDDADDDRAIQPSISLHVTIDKGEGLILEFGCNLNPDELEIESMASKNRDDLDSEGAYQGPEFSDLDENLQKALHKYLETRGIGRSLHSFLYEYMMNKDEREYLTWLKNIKDFVGK